MMQVLRKIDKLGRVVLPLDFRRALGLEAESSVLLNISGDIITVRGVESRCKLCGSADAVSDLGACRKCIKRIKSISE